MRAFVLTAALVAALLSTSSAQSPAPTGTIRGRVTLTSATFTNPPIRMGMDPACASMNAGHRPVQEFVVRNAEGGLANVFVHLQGGFPRVAPPTTPVRLEQHGCVYQPHVIGLQVGQRLVVANTDPTMHNVHALSEKGNAFNISQPRGGEPFTFTAAAEELMMRVTCDTHDWMNIYVGVVAHPYFSVTSADGTFTIANVPVGHHRIDTWHERFGPLTADVDVVQGETATVDFTYSGEEKAAPPF